MRQTQAAIRETQAAMRETQAAMRETQAAVQRDLLGVNTRLNVLSDTIIGQARVLPVTPPRV